ncbi:myogenesis-regulating glycosidase-like [Schistocerca serialis cubense]|uniref:myogenesis-regulating glycosidase-like n=1 Tax=Schistocerca serialis cubense TaxID=2023355 RepID=UPI00214F3196|nr:myogenesis-regulating glycosidase-like [Schistocerca serialis cubense]
MPGVFVAVAVNALSLTTRRSPLPPAVPATAVPLLVALGLLVAPAAASLSTRYDEAAGRVQILSHKDGSEVEIGYIPISSEERSHAPRHVRGTNGESFYFGDHKIAFRRQGREGRCLGVRQWVSTPQTVLTSCQNHLTSHIYGGIEKREQKFLIEDTKYENFPYITDQSIQAGIAVRYWLFSDGRFVYVHSNVPLFINQNTNQSVNAICFTAENKSPYPADRADNLLEWDLCSFEDAREAHEFAVQNYLGKPTAIPDDSMVLSPVWATLVRYGKNTTEESVRKLANEVIAHGFNKSHIEIDQKWETCYGSQTFDTTKFPDIKKLTDDLHDLGFRVVLWNHPFVNKGCEPYYSEALEKGYFVTNANGKTETKFQNEVAGAVDFTNPDAVSWWTNRLLALRNETGIDGFEFTAGEVDYLPQPANIEPKEVSPIAYSDAFAQTIAQFGSMVSIQTGVESQKLPNFFLMDIVLNSWSGHGGYDTLIPKLLQINLVGHPFVLPEMIGGSVQNGKPASSELFLRWLEATVFMPVVKFSYPPWDYDNETLEIARNLTDLHAKYAPRIVELMQKAVEDGTPVNLPVWWLDPTDSTAQTIDSEFLLGEDILVAPVIYHKNTDRDIYLPKGTWRDEVDPEHPTIEGPTWLRDYPAPLNTLPYFTRVTSS